MGSQFPQPATASFERRVFVVNRDYCSTYEGGISRRILSVDDADIADAILNVRDVSPRFNIDANLVGPIAKTARGSCGIRYWRERC